MATVVRVKRRLDEDPMDILYLASKRTKGDTKLSHEELSLDPSNSFKFVGTVKSKKAIISQPVREAIRKEKLEREYKKHQLNILGEVRNETRQHNRKKSKQNRFKITSKHRTPGLESLDKIVSTCTDDEADTQPIICQLCGKTLKQQNSGSKSSCDCRNKESKTDKTNFTESEPTNSALNVKNKEKNDDENNKENSCVSENETIKSKTGTKVAGTTKVKGCDTVVSSSTNTTDRTTTGIAERDATVGDTDRMFCLVDMEVEDGPTWESMLKSSMHDQITCNSEPLVRERVSEPGHDDEYVYDLYYTNSRDFDYGIFEHGHTFEAFNHDFRYDREMPDDEEELAIEHDEDDENVEANWRNDYPDVDPRFIENQEDNYYREDMNEYQAFESETGNQMAEWMNWKCKIDDGDDLSSDDDPVGQYEGTDDKMYGAGSSYNAYYKRVRKEMCEGEGDSDDSKD